VNQRIVDGAVNDAEQRPERQRAPDDTRCIDHYANEPAVREGLVQSIVQQESPLVQSALADVMLKLLERRSIPPFKKLLFQKDLNGQVRSKIEQTISRLI